MRQHNISVYPLPPMHRYGYQALLSMEEDDLISLQLPVDSIKKLTSEYSRWNVTTHHIVIDTQPLP